MRPVGAAVALLVLAVSWSPGPSASAAHVHINAPAWSSDGKWIAWTEGVGAESRIWIATPDLKDASPITPGIDALGQVSWLPRHRLLYWANFRLFSIRPRGRSTLVRSVPGVGFALNRTGTRVAVGDSPCSTGCNGPVLVFGVSGRRTQKVGGSNAQNMSPTFSRAGRDIAFDRALCASTGRCETPVGLWIASLKSGKLRSIVSGTTGCSTSSPSGGAIAYVDLGNVADEALRVVPIGGGASNLLMHDVGCNLSFPPAWSSDGRRVAAVDQRRGQLLVGNVKTLQTRAVTGVGVGSVTGFAWSPDSLQLLVTAQPAGGVGCSSLWRITVKTGAAKKLRAC